MSWETTFTFFGANQDQSPFLKSALEILSTGLFGLKPAWEYERPSNIPSAKALRSCSDFFSGAEPNYGGGNALDDGRRANGLAW